MNASESPSKTLLNKHIVSITKVLIYEVGAD